MSIDDEPITTIIERARALDPPARAEFVRRACGSNETLLSRVMLALNESATRPEFWDEVATGEHDAMEIASSLEGQRLGPYRILRKLGSGGMGDVYLAERADEEYQQRVAIKLVRGGLFSPQIHSRLRMERQILATLQHPNIARLLDGGRTPDGIPYLVMEYIDGEPIDTYCDRHRLGIEDRLRLVRTVCSAVHYAHQNLIVHRDLKPNNILITPDGVPKLLDFGIAKLLDSRQSPQTMALTQVEYRVMTPAHASPEQIRGDAITTASDIYVLGVLLYELACGRRPFKLDGNSLVEMERVVCGENAPLPSAMLARTAQESPELLADIAACRSTGGSRLQKQLRGDLDNIISKAMRKDPERRYSSAEQLAADLDRHLFGQPVLATSDTWLYRTGKFVSRHVFAVSASVAAVIMLAGFAVVTFLQAQRIAEERDIATTERTRAEQVSSFLVELFELSDPSRSRGSQVTARELLDIGARRVSIGLNSQPETRATLLSTIGRVYSSLGLYSDSVSLLQEALESRIRLHGPKHPKVAIALVALGTALWKRGDLQEGEKRLNAALEMQRDLLGPTAIDVAPTLMAQANLAVERGALEIAEQYYMESLSIYRRHNQESSSAAASVMSELASLYSYRGEHDRAVTLFRAALDINRQTLGSDHPEVGLHTLNLAVAFQMQGKLAEAEPLYVDSIRMLSKVLGNTHPETLDTLANYGRFLHRKGDLARAEDVLSNVLALDRNARGERHAYVGHDLVNLAMLRLDTNRNEDAMRNLKAALEIYGESLPSDHPYVASALSGLGRAQLEQGQLKEAEQTLGRAVQIATKSLPADSGPLAAAKSSLGRTLLAQHRFEEAASLLHESFPILVKAYGADAVIVKRAREALAETETLAKNPQQR